MVGLLIELNCSCSLLRELTFSESGRVHSDPAIEELTQLLDTSILFMCSIRGSCEVIS